MKRSIPQKLKLCSTFLLSTCLALPCIAIQEVSPPDNNLHATSALTTPAIPTEPVRASSVSSTIAPKSPQAKLILLQTDHQTDSSQASKTNSRAKNGNWATLSPLPGAQTQTSGKLTLLPMGSKTKKPTTPDNLEIPHHVLYPNENKTPARQVKATERKPIVLQNTITNVREDKPKSGQLQIIKNDTAPTQPQRAGSVTLQPIVLKSKTAQTQKTSTETSQLQIIQNRPKHVSSQPIVAHPTNHNENNFNHSIQPIILNGKKSNRIRTHRTTKRIS